MNHDLARVSADGPFANHQGEKGGEEKEDTEKERNIKRRMRKKRNRCRNEEDEMKRKEGRPVPGAGASERSRLRSGRKYNNTNAATRKNEDSRACPQMVRQGTNQWQKEKKGVGGTLMRLLVEPYSSKTNWLRSRLYGGSRSDALFRTIRLLIWPIRLHSHQCVAALPTTHTNAHADARTHTHTHTHIHTSGRSMSPPSAK